MKVSNHLRSNLTKIEFFIQFLRLIKPHSVSPFLFFHGEFSIIWFYSVIFYRDHIYFIECFIEIFYSMQFMVFWNEKWSEIMDSWQSPALFLCLQKLVVRFIYKFSSVSWVNYLSNRRLAKVTSHWVCKIRKVTKLPPLLLIESCFPPVDTLKQVSNESNVQRQQ